MSESGAEWSVFKDQTNTRTRCIQPPGGVSSFALGGDYPNDVKTDAVKPKNRQASSIFGSGENTVPAKTSNWQNEDTKSRVFGGECLLPVKQKNKCKGFNPITGELEQGDGRCDEEEGKDVNIQSSAPVITTGTTAADGVTIPTSTRQPPGGKSTKLW